MKNTLLVLIAILGCSLFHSCKKYLDTQQDLGGEKFIRGRLFILDSFKSAVPQSATAGFRIYLSQEATGENYLLSQTTDAEGYFLFKNLKEELRCTPFVGQEKGVS